MKLIKLFAFFALVLFTGVLFAQDAAPADPTFLDSVLKFIASPGGIVSVVVMLAEAALRMYPSQKALSLLVVFRYVTKSGIVIFTFLDGILVGIIGTGQRLKAAPKAVHHAKKR
jgi:hypothetical protein